MSLTMTNNPLLSCFVIVNKGIQAAVPHPLIPFTSPAVDTNTGNISTLDNKYHVELQLNTISFSG